MKTIICTAALLTAFLASGSAFAGEMKGTIKDVDKMKHTITMDDGMSVMANENVKLDNLMKGDNVTVMTDDKNMATAVEKQ